MPSSRESTTLDPGTVPGFQGLDHVAIAVPAGTLEAHVASYRALGFQEIHREEVGGGDQVREVLLSSGAADGLGAVQLLEREPPSHHQSGAPYLRCSERDRGGREGERVRCRAHAARRAHCPAWPHSSTPRADCYAETDRSGCASPRRRAVRGRASAPTPARRSRL
jgi:catechol 2,3-dioxygenase-like lactoylglutathione lyase family enzyme